MGFRDIVITGYSFKGGSGRTTAAVNLSGALLSLGCKVVTIDMDFGSPGMRTILYRSFYQDEFEKYLDSVSSADCPFDKVAIGEQIKDIGIHEYMDGKFSDPDEFVVSCCYDYWHGRETLKSSEIKREVHNEGQKPAERRLGLRENKTLAEYFDKFYPDIYSPDTFYTGELLFIPGSFHERKISALGQKSRNFQGRFAALQDAVRRYFLIKDPAGMKKDEIIYYILDSASGVSPNSLPVLLLSDILMVFFRWSLQHYYGTRENLKILNIFLSDSRALGTRMFLVGNCAPTEKYIKEYLIGAGHLHLIKIARWYQKEKANLEGNVSKDWSHFGYLGDIYDEAFLRLNETFMFRDTPKADDVSGLAEQEVKVHQQNIRQFHKIAVTIKEEGEQICYERELRESRLRCMRSLRIQRG